MIDPFTTVALSLSGLAAIAMLVAGGLSGWRGWLQLKRAEAERREAPAPAPAGARIEIADLRERVRKLEAIAAGVDL